MLNPQFRNLVSNWRGKADQYGTGDLASAFDRFFTLYVVYNQLYVALTIEMARNGTIKLKNRDSFPDARAAKDYVRQQLGCRNMMAALDANEQSSQAMRDAAGLLAGPVNGRRFNINLNRLTGEEQPSEDAKHLSLFQSNNVNDRARAVLQFIYAVRCNLFHGQKSFEGVQIEVMGPANVLLRHLVDLLFEHLNRP